MNDWENQLRSWTPRRPSTRLEQRLFGVRAAAAPVHGHSLAMRSPWVWLAPAVCGLLLMLAILAGRSLPVAATAHAVALNTPPGSDAAVYCAMDTSSRENVWTVATFDWTKGANYLSTTGSFPMWKTNIQKL